MTMHCQCGQELVEVLGEETITTLDHDEIVFRRRTDYLLCRSCRELYSVEKLRGRSYPDGLDAPFVEKRSGDSGQDDDLFPELQDGDGTPVYSIEVAQEDIDSFERQLSSDPVPLEDQFDQ